MDERTWNTECSQATCDVDPIGSSEWLDERIGTRAGRRDHVWVRDHPLDLSNPILVSARRAVLARWRQRRRDVVERLVLPDPGDVEGRGDGDLLEVAAGPHNRGAEVQYSVDMVPRGGEVVPQVRGVIAQNHIDSGGTRQQA